MHHTLRFYRRHQGSFLRFYILGGRLTRLPVVGRLVRAVASSYGYNMHTSYSVSLAQAHQVVEQSSQLLLGPCRCRRVFRRCQAPLQAEIVIGVGARAFPQERPGEYQAITREQAHALLDECHRQGLFHTLMQCQKQFYALCNCCRCCCVPTRLRADYGIRGTLTRLDGSALPPELVAGKRPRHDPGDSLCFMSKRPPGRPGPREVQGLHPHRGVALPQINAVPWSVLRHAEALFTYQVTQVLVGVIGYHPQVGKLPG